MKANEAPEKLYIDLFKGEFNVSYSPINNSVEYTRTDAFIEKICEWLEPNVKIILCGDKIDTDRFIEEFKNYMKGE